MKDEEKDWILISSQDCIGETKSEKSTLKMLTLRHPGSQGSSKFLYNTEKRKIFELTSHKDKYSSWFVDSTVKENGALHIATAFDPLYVILFYLHKNRLQDKFMLLNQILVDEEFPDCRNLDEGCSNDAIQQNIADSSGSGKFVGYRYSQKKTMKWLRIKVNQTAKAIKDSGIFIAQSEDDVSSKENEGIEHLEYAFGIVCNYVNEDIKEHLRKHLGLRSRAEKRRSVDAGNHVQAKKPKNEKLNDSKSKQPAKMSRAQKKLSKVNVKGMKSISSFFPPPNKK